VVLQLIPCAVAYGLPLSMLKDPSFSLIDVPSKLKELRRCWPHVTTVAGRVVVSTPPVPFCPISTLSTDATTVQLIRPRDVVRVLMGNPEISRFATAEQLMPRELSGGAVELFAHTLGWAKGPFSSWNISDRYFATLGCQIAWSTARSSSSWTSQLVSSTSGALLGCT
jgi:hypothetical protein